MPVFELTEDILFPPPELAEESGILAVGGDLSIERLLLAYELGIFPWYSEGEPIIWWSPDPRMVLFPEEFRVSRSLNRVIKSGVFQVTADTAFTDVIVSCAAIRYPGREDTWITPDMILAYCRLHDAGYAHSVECWRDGRLAGGLYGVSLGRCFFGESMFSLVSNASKVALATLIERRASHGLKLIDCQVANPHLGTLGAREIPRDDFLAFLESGLDAPTLAGPWTF